MSKKEVKRGNLGLTDDTWSVLKRQCLNRRIAEIDTVEKEVAAWQEFRNNKIATVNWQFTNDDARYHLEKVGECINPGTNIL